MIHNAVANLFVCKRLIAQREKNIPHKIIEKVAFFVEFWAQKETLAKKRKQEESQSG